MIYRLSFCLLGAAGLALAVFSHDRAGGNATEKRAEVAGASEEMVRIAADPTKAVRQGDTEGCGPVALLNLLKFGPESFRKAYDGISQGNDRRALSLLADKYCSAKGADGKVRYSNQTGIDDPNLSRLCDRIAAEYKLGAIDTLYTTREQEESNSAFARRVNQVLVRSLSRGVPALMSIDSYGVRENKWEKLTGHYMLFIAVQRMGPTNPSSFLTEYINPADGEHRQALVYAGRRNHDGAYAHFKEGDQWLKENPYLCLASPDTDLRQTELGSHARHEFFLTILFGSFAD